MVMLDVLAATLLLGPVIWFTEESFPFGLKPRGAMEFVEFVYYMSNTTLGASGLLLLSISLPPWLIIALALDYNAVAST